MREEADVGDGGGTGLTAPLLPGGSGDAGADDSLIEKGLGSEGADDKRAPWAVTVATLLSLSLGWGLWLMPQGFARLGWLPAVRPASPVAVLPCRASAPLCPFVRFQDICARFWACCKCCASSPCFGLP